MKGDANLPRCARGDANAHWSDRHVHLIERAHPSSRVHDDGGACRAHGNSREARPGADDLRPEVHCPADGSNGECTYGVVTLDERTRRCCQTTEEDVDSEGRRYADVTWL